MNACEFQNLLQELLEELRFADDDGDGLTRLAQQIFRIRTIKTFDDAGVARGNDGLVVRCDDGSELYVNIVRHR